MRFLVTDINPVTRSLTGNSGVLVRNHSLAFATMDFEETTVNLDTCIIRNGGETIYGNEGTFPNVASNVFEFSCEDADDNVIRETVTATMIDYINLTCHAADGTTYNKPDATGAVTLCCGGDYFNSSFGVYANTLTVQYRYRAKGGTWSSYSAMSVTASSNSYIALANLSGLDYQLAYDFEFVASDRLMTVTASSLNVVSKPVFHWGENDVTFEVPVTFNKGVGDLMVGDYLVFGSTQSYLAEGDAGYLQINAQNRLSLYAPELTFNGTAASFSQYGLWTPTLSCSGVYLSQSGWYSKTGNVVTVGFYVKMICDSGYENTRIMIFGLPFTPAIAAAGGGMCSGAYVSAGLNFQCFVAEADGTITTRVQACNNTANGNLSTSASGCWYSSASELTLSGTITYMTA